MSSANNLSTAVYDGAPDDLDVSGQDTDEAPTFLRVTVEARYENTPLVTLTRLVYSQE